MIKKESLYLQYWDENNLHGKANSKKLPANNFDWIGIFLNLTKTSQKTIMKKVLKFLKLMLNILENYINFIMIYHFFRKACS